MEHSKSHKKTNPYTTFFFMIALSFVAMYITMYFNTYSIDHVYFSMTRFYMVCLGTATMTVIMLLLMLGMYKNKKKNTGILLGSLVLFTSALFLVRTQKPIIGDVLWLKAMIPHHSIALLTSERADIKDAEVKKLADAIIEAQRKEIEQMKVMIKRLENEK